MVKKDIIIIGGGGLGRELLWLLKRINSVEDTWNILGFIDDNLQIKDSIIDGLPVIGSLSDLIHIDHSINVVCGIADPHIKKNIVEKCLSNSNIIFPNIVDPTASIGFNIKMGIGNVIFANTFIMLDLKIGNFCLIHNNSEVCHDDVVGNYVTIFHSVNLSGHVTIGDCSELGTGVRVNPGISIGNSVIVGAGAVVNKNLPDCCTAVGIPAKPIKFNK